MNSEVFKKSVAEKATIKAVKSAYFKNKRKTLKTTNNKAWFGLRSNKMSDIGSLLKQADAIELEFASVK